MQWHSVAVDPAARALVEGIVSAKAHPPVNLGGYDGRDMERDKKRTS